MISANKIIFTSFYILLLLTSCSKEPANTTPDIMDTVVSFNVSSPLDNQLKEISGLELDNNGRYWGNNDHGNPNVLFGFNTNGILEKEIQLNGVDNTDWEDLAMDKNDNLYIGDFGNNDNDRNDLNIYIIPEFSSLTTSTVVPQIIHFNLEDQDQFPPPNNQKHFDLESFFAFNDTLYLFSKDRSTPFEGKTNMYKLPAKAGTYQAVLVTSFFTDNEKEKGEITAADISPDGNNMALLSEGQLYLFSNFENNNFFSGKVEKFEFPVKRKYEGIVFIDDNELAVVNEEKYNESPQLLFISFSK